MLTYDVNGISKYYFSVEKYNKTGDAVLDITKEDSIIRSKGYDYRLDDNMYIGVNYQGGEDAYKVYSNGVESSFGEYMIPDIKQSFGAHLLYNSDRELLIVGAMDINYFGCYKKDGNNFNLVWENRQQVYDYTENNNQIVFDNTKKGVYDMALTKDFIVTIQRDYENDPTNESQVGRDIEKLPRTLFKYDYDGNLLEIINYNVPIGRIAGNINNNNIYAIYVEPDYKLGISLIE